MDIGKKIKYIRTEKGITQKELASKLGTSQQNLAQYENGKRNPKLETVRKIAEALDVTISELQPDWAQFSKDEILQDLTYHNNYFLEKAPPLEKRNSRMTQRLAGYKIQLDNAMKQLNDKGQSKAIEQVELLTKIPEYRKNTEE